MKSFPWLQDGTCPELVAMADAPQQPPELPGLPAPAVQPAILDTEQVSAASASSSSSCLRANSLPPTSDYILFILHHIIYSI